MKKFIISIFAIIYLGASVGTSVNMHYCMGKLAGWAFGSDNSKSCIKCGMEKKNKGGCCHDEHKFVKSSIDQKTVEAGVEYVKTFTTTPSEFPEFAFISLPPAFARSYATHDPPSHLGVSIYIFNCSYRI